MGSQNDLFDILRQIPAIPGYVLTAGQLIRFGYQRYMARRRKRLPPASEIIDHRIRIRKEIEERLTRYPPKPGEPPYTAQGYEEIVVHDIRRHNAFPGIEPDGIGISPWIKFEVHDLYHRGIEVFLSDFRKAIQVADEHRIATWRLLDRDEEGDYPGAVTAIPIGRIPFEFIDRIDWARDEYYGAPHFYCRYDGPFREPYEEIIYRAKLYSGESGLYHELHGLHPERDDWGWVHRWAFLVQLEMSHQWRRLRRKREH